MILKTSNLVVGYKNTKATQIILSDVNLSIESGKMIAIIGVNGSGKSTLLRSITGVQTPISGEVLINETNINQLNDKVLASKISLVLTNQHISKNLSVFELISLGRHPYTNWLGINNASDKKIILKAIEEVDLQSLKHKKCNELSDGQLQKVLLARAIAQNTPLIVLDEPTTHLDMYHKAQVLHLLKEVCVKTNKTVIFASHEINLAIQLCDQIILINQTKAVQGSPSALIKNGSFNELFPKDLIEFDPLSKSFRVANKRN
ncbi:MAG: ABC transporter ATP-binding protein [Psychroflexus maritimus]|uniref:ABC transporter ATP-binding protein n=1 Tax=Psychroflexus maritimus TaxID=2714865 RepID=UPI0016512A47|nr:ABC transporter ATP-binding protein [Psychroflexus maritimus]